MEREWLAGQLAAGRSIEAIAREVGRDPSTVAHWVNKHGLTSQHAAKHAARGGLSRETLARLLAEGLTVRAMAERLRVSYTTVRHWLRKYDLTTQRGAKLASTKAAREAGLEEAVLDCPIHGPTRHIRRLDGGMRCLACRSAAVSERRRRVKSILVAELGGGCAICGYDRSAAALHFHHVDPSSNASPSRCAGSRCRSSRCARRRRSASCSAHVATPRWRAAKLGYPCPAKGPRRAVDE